MGMVKCRVRVGLAVVLAVFMGPLIGNPTLPLVPTVHFVSIICSFLSYLFSTNSQIRQLNMYTMFNKEGGKMFFVIYFKL